MNWPWRFSDAEYVERVERQIGWHRPVGIFLAVVSALFVGLGGYLLHRMQTGGIPIFDETTTQHSFQIGLSVGLLSGKLVFWAIFAFVSGLYFYFAGRKDRLLVAYHRRLVELGASPNDVI